MGCDCDVVAVVVGHFCFRIIGLGPHEVEGRKKEDTMKERFIFESEVGEDGRVNVSD